MNSDEKAFFASALLKNKFEQLGRLPEKKDFSPEEVCFIKQKLGPWPRALEAAGLKDPPEISSKEKNRIKRKRSRKNRKMSSKEERK